MKTQIAGEFVRALAASLTSFALLTFVAAAPETNPLAANTKVVLLPHWIPQAQFADISVLALQYRGPDRTRAGAFARSGTRTSVQVA